MSRQVPATQPKLISEDIDSWEKEVESLPGVSRLSLEDSLYLEAALGLYNELDSYRTSSTYYYFTGRDGLWRYSRDGEDIYFCWHPNVHGCALIFPPFSQRGWELIRGLLENLPVPPNGLRLVRVNFGDCASLSGFLGQCSRVQFSIIQEDVLDWYYPVRIVSTDILSRLPGRKFHNIRKELSHIKAHSIQSEELNFGVHLPQVRLILHRWASSSSNSRDQYADLYETYDRFFRLAFRANSTTEGLLYHVDGKPAAVSIWDISKRGSIANMYVNLCDPIAGLPEYTLINMNCQMAKRGVKRVNLGGSETRSLDFFKAKFRPIESIDLRSVELSLEQGSNVESWKDHDQFA